MKITYISQATIPSRSADSIQVMKACESLNAEYCSAELMLTNRKNYEHIIKDIFVFYNCKKHFKISWYSFPILPERYGIIIVALISTFCKSDLVLSRSIPAAFICALLGKKVIVEIHEPFDSSVSLKLLSPYLLRLTKLKGVITNCEALRVYTIKKYPFIQNKCISVQNGANDPGEVVSVDLKSGNRVNVGYTGQLYKGKGLEIIGHLAPLHPNVLFHIVGGMKEDIDYWTNQLASAKNVIFHGFISPSKISEYISAFDIVLAPYQRIVYGFEGKNNLADWTSPMKVFDYMSMGKPIIASDLPFMREVLENMETALLCEPENVESWSKALSKLTDNKKLSSELGQKAKQKFLKEYSWERRAKKINVFINDVIQNSSKAFSK